MNTDPSEFTVHDGLQPYTFAGHLLGYSTSNTAGRVRWTEVEIYRTEGGRWVVHTVGASDVYHQPSLPCGRTAKNGQRVPYSELNQHRDPCPDCFAGDATEPNEVLVEGDIHETRLATTLVEFKEAITAPTGGKLSSVAQAALDQAMQADEGIGGLFTPERIS